MLERRQINAGASSSIIVTSPLGFTFLCSFFLLPVGSTMLLQARIHDPFVPSVAMTSQLKRNTHSSPMSCLSFLTFFLSSISRLNTTWANDISYTIDQSVETRPSGAHNLEWTIDVAEETFPDAFNAPIAVNDMPWKRPDFHRDGFSALAHSRSHQHRSPFAQRTQRRNPFANT